MAWVELYQSHGGPAFFGSKGIYTGVPITGRGVQYGWVGDAVRVAVEVRVAVGVRVVVAVAVRVAVGVDV
ncbi:MAG TPA: hypothetical protein VIO36_11735, partial [Anaerolineaceae bacterium]